MIKNNELFCDYCGEKINKRINSLVTNSKQNFCNLECYHLSRRQKDKIYLENNFAYFILQKGDVIKKVIIDIEDIEKVQQYKWHLHYRKRDKRFDVCSNQYETRKYLILPRYLMNCPDNMTIDHINRDTMDNRKNNLRICSIFSNNLNKGNNKSGCVGVCWDKRKKKWHVMFKEKNLGRYDTFEEAVKVRKQAEKEYLEKITLMEN